MMQVCKIWAHEFRKHLENQNFSRQTTRKVPYLHESNFSAFDSFVRTLLDQPSYAEYIIYPRFPNIKGTKERHCKESRRVMEPTINGLHEVSPSLRKTLLDMYSTGPALAKMSLVLLICKNIERVGFSTRIDSLDAEALVEPLMNEISKQSHMSWKLRMLHEVEFYN
jgi:hypothetical protein